MINLHVPFTGAVAPGTQRRKIDDLRVKTLTERLQNPLNVALSGDVKHR